MNDVDKNAKIIWDYMLMHQELKPMDAIFVLGSNDLRVAGRAADLYLNKYAPTIIFSGKSGKHPSLDKSEADAFADIAIARGVPAEKIIREDQATNTGENIIFTRRLLADKKLNFKSFLLVQKPYMERRTYATFSKQWSGVEFAVTSPLISYENYADPKYHADKDRFINVMVGDLQRIKEYPEKGFQIAQEIPESVWAAYEALVNLGYTRHLISV